MVTFLAFIDLKNSNERDNRETMFQVQLIYEAERKVFAGAKSFGELI